MKELIIIFLLMGTVSGLNAQVGDNNKTFPSVICEYTLPLNRNGLSVTAFFVEPYIYLDRFEKSSKIILNIKKTQGIPQNPNPSFKYSYNYNGKQYGNESLGHDVFNDIIASTITYEVLVTYGSQSWGWVKVDGRTNQFGPIDKDAKASDINVRVRVVGIGSFSGTSNIESKIKTLLQPTKTENTKLSNNINKVNNEQINNNSSSKNNTTNQGLNNISSNYNSTPKNTSVVSSQLSQKIKVNGQEVQVYQQGGKYYMLNSDGSQHETSQQAYNTVQQASNKKTTNANNDAQATTTARKNYETTQETQRQAHDLQQSKALQQAQRSSFVDQQLFSSFYAAQAATDSKARLDANSKLSGNYESVEQLNEDFNYKYNSISATVQEWTDAKNESLNAAASILTSSNNTTTQTVGLAASIIGGLINEGNAEKEERERKAKLEKQRETELAVIEAKRKAALAELRHKLLSQYPEGGIPLSAHHITIPEIYFFAYHFDRTSIRNNKATIVVSEVFPLAKYKDDTWPYKNLIIREIQQKMGKTDNITLMGYYTTKKLADDMRDALITLAPKASFVVMQVDYKGKPKDNNENNDFWGESKKKSSENQHSKTADFWGSPAKKIEKAVDKPVAQDSSSKKQKLDFWGNPIK